MFGGIGGLEIIIILVVGVILFGVIKMPQIARLLGSGFGGYNKLKRGLDFDSLMNRMAGGNDDAGDGGRQQEGPERGGQGPGWQKPYPQGGPDQGLREPPRGGGENLADGPDSTPPDRRA